MSAPTYYQLLDAYGVLQVKSTAAAAEIHRAYRQLARGHHPDLASDSAAAAAATQRMSEINDAYALIRDAPLRHRPLEAPPDSDLVWSQTQVDEALRRARSTRVVQGIVDAATAAVLGLICVFALGASQSLNDRFGVGVAVAIPAGAALTTYLLRDRLRIFPDFGLFIEMIRLFIPR